VQSRTKVTSWQLVRRYARTWILLIINGNESNSYFQLVVWAKWTNLFLDLPEHSSCAKNQTQRQMHIRHSDVFVWSGVWFFGQLLSHLCARRCHFCMGIFLKSLHYVIWIVYLINIHYVTIYDDYIVIICNNNNSTGSNEDGGSLHVWISSAAHSHRSNNLPVRLFAHNHARLSIVHIYYLNSIARSWFSFVDSFVRSFFWPTYK
jgi:hypothetical protein